MKSDLTTINLTLNQISFIIADATDSLGHNEVQAVAEFPQGNWTEYDLNSVALAQALLYFKNLSAAKRLELNLVDMENTIEYLTNRSHSLEQFYQKMETETDDIKLAMANINEEIIKLRKQIVQAKKTSFSAAVPAEVYNCILKFSIDKI